MAPTVFETLQCLGWRCSEELCVRAGADEHLHHLLARGSDEGEPAMTVLPVAPSRQQEDRHAHGVQEGEIGEVDHDRSFRSLGLRESVLDFGRGSEVELSRDLDHGRVAVLANADGELTRNLSAVTLAISHCGSLRRHKADQSRSAPPPLPLVDEGCGSKVAMCDRALYPSIRRWVTAL